jgi:cell division transport system permease protein
MGTMPSAKFSDSQEPEVPKNTFRYFFGEAVRRVWIARRTSFVAVAMIALSLFILGAFVLLSENLERAMQQWQGRSRVTIYLHPEVTPEQLRGVDNYLAAHPELAARRFITKEVALKRFKSYFTNLAEVVGELDENPFPPSFEVEVTPQIAQSQAFDREMNEVRKLDGVDQLQFDWEWTRRLRRIIDVVNLVGLAAGGVLAIAAAFTIANVIRLTMLMYREEIEIMRLVGATERIIRGPFLLEGLLQGTIGGLLAVILLAICFFAAQRTLAPSSSLLWGFLFGGFLPWQKLVALVAGGMFAGWFGSWLSVREHARETG